MNSVFWFGVSCLDCVQCTDWVCRLMHLKHVSPGGEEGAFRARKFGTGVGGGWRAGQNSRSQNISWGFVSSFDLEKSHYISRSCLETHDWWKYVLVLILNFFLRKNKYIISRKFKKLTAFFVAENTSPDIRTNFNLKNSRKSCLYLDSCSCLKSQDY